MSKEIEVRLLKKINVLLLSVFLIVLSVIATFTITTLLQVDTGDKVVISQAALNEYQATVDKYREIEELKDYIQTNYYLDVTEETLIEGMK
jgi:hypothetical protein